MSFSPGSSPTDAVPPPSYQLSQQEFDRKTSHAIQLSNSIPTPAVDADGWPIYNTEVFEAVAASFNAPILPPASSSTGLSEAEMPRHDNPWDRPNLKLPLPGPPLKHARPSGRRHTPPAAHDFPLEGRNATPPPPFTPTGPSLDGPPFEEVVRLSYQGPDSRAASPLGSPQHLRSRQLQLPPVTQPEANPRRPAHSHSSSQARISSIPYSSHRLTPTPSNVYPRPNPASTITRVEFDPKMAYSPYGRMDEHTSAPGGASMFYNHAVASQLATNSSMSTSPQAASTYPESVTPTSYPSSYSPSSYRGHRASSSMSSMSPDDRFATSPWGAAPPHMTYTPQPVSPPAGAGFAHPPNGSARGPLPSVPQSNVPSQHQRWAGSEAQLVHEMYGGHG
ncbi:hypothetical protein BC834DRAFT_198528 [Gloeopeniophorella convolvens]|nr:hypothetical protein BC834DRAFT_198528 [Gloeopeniophorella convolvens]